MLRNIVEWPWEDWRIILREILAKWVVWIGGFWKRLRILFFDGLFSYECVEIPVLVLWCYSRITSTKSTLFCVTAFSASLWNLTVLPQSLDYSCYVSRPILAPLSLWLQKHTDLRAQPSDLRHQPRLTKATCAWRWRLCEINPAIHVDALGSVMGKEICIDVWAVGVWCK